jgi:hypothetical protein
MEQTSEFRNKSRNRYVQHPGVRQHDLIEISYIVESSVETDYNYAPIYSEPRLVRCIPRARNAAGIRNEGDDKIRETRLLT